MSHLGLVSATAAAAKGFQVVGFDPDAALIASLEQGRLPVVEPDLDELVAANRERLSFTAGPGGLAACDLVYIARDVPTDDQGQSDLGPIEELMALVRAAMRPQALLVILCQVPPGFSRRQPGPKGGLYYQVETLIFGRAVERALKPERFIVGCPDPDQPLPPALAEYLKAFGCPILPMRFESAELAKIAINCCLVSSISVANTLAELCEGIGADWREIAPALRLDRRIGAYAYLAPGLGIAGGNLERDLATVVRLGSAQGSDVGVVRSWLANSGHRRFWALRTLHAQVLDLVEEPVIAVLGLAYKENTASTKNSPSLALIANLRPFALQVFDPVVPAAAAQHPRLRGAEGALQACQGADALVIMTPWPEFARLEPAELAQALKGKVVIDPYGVLKGPACLQAGLRYFTLGARALT